MIAVTHALIGIEVLRRGIIFIDLAVAQVAGLGLVVATMLAHDPSPWLMQGTALSCAVLAGLLFHQVERIMPRQQEAVIGSSFVLAASLVILLLADHPHGGEEMWNLMSGQVLFVTWMDLANHAPVYALIVAAWFIRPSLQGGIGFYLLFALAITSSVQLVGVYVVFSSLILPALAAAGSVHPRAVAVLCGLLAVPAGIAAALLSDLPAGPVIVVSYVLTGIVFSLCAVRL